ncbi:unnamed protein product [Closterium sp. Naga37s-1]|nr:unnamed protein product [Closterium sp. Naga37s-1]
MLSCNGERYIETPCRETPPFTPSSSPLALSPSPPRSPCSQPSLSSPPLTHPHPPLLLTLIPLLSHPHPPPLSPHLPHSSLVSARSPTPFPPGSPVISPCPPLIFPLPSILGAAWGSLLGVSEGNPWHLLPPLHSPSLVSPNSLLTSPPFSSMA